MGELVTAARIALGAVLATLAMFAALLAADVRSWPAELASGDRIYAASPSLATWTPPARLGGVAQDLLGVRDDLRHRRALQLYHESTSAQQRLDNALDVQTARTEAQNALAAVAGDSSPQRASQALTLLGIIAAEGGSTQADAALSDFTDAVRTDPGNEHAKYDLELLLRLTAANDVRAGAGEGSGSGKSGQSGAAGRPPGRGY